MQQRDLSETVGDVAAPEERAIFMAAVEIAPDEARAAYLASACGADGALRRRVEALLESHRNAAGDFLEAAPLEAFPPGVYATPVTAGAGTRIGPYKLLQKLGEGGMGIVFMAEQEQPVRRKVALKIIKPGMDSAQVAARFEAERQALALMDHANIARVLDAGATEAGLPYFVMELVHGTPLTQYCDDQRLTVRERLELSVPVCHAVQHAHQKGVIHRDLKPSNVLVTMYDGRPVPKVIDFGVAKAVDQRLTERTLFTQYGALVGTFEYMAPEQAEMSALGVDTRSDIYSLGVMLYELLTGTTPLDRAQVREAGFGEVLRLIREQEPPPPSTRLSGSGAEALASISARRKTEPRRLPRQVRGELDWIVLKCLEKDRTRRYESAADLSRDLQRYLADEAVQACPPSAAYRLRKMGRKHRAALATAAAFAVLLGAAAAVSTWQAVRATGVGREMRAQRDRAAVAEITAKREAANARTERDRAVTAERAAKQLEAVAREERAIAHEVAVFLQDDLLGQASAHNQAAPGRTPDRDVTLRTVLDRAAERLGDKFKDRPVLEAALRQTVGNTYAGLGENEAARQHLERARELRRRALGEEHLDTLASMINLANVYADLGLHDQAGQLYGTVREVARRVLGPDHAHTYTTSMNLAMLYHKLGDGRRAEPLMRETLETRRRLLGEEDPETLTAMNNLGAIYSEQGKFDKAEPLLTHALEARRRVLGEDHPWALASLNNLARQYYYQGRYRDAEPLYERALEASSRVLGEEHSDTFSALNNLAMLYVAQRRHDKALPLLKRGLESHRRVHGEDHPRTPLLTNNLAMAYAGHGDAARAEPLYAQALDGARRLYGEAHPQTLTFSSNLASLYTRLGRHDEAETLLVEGLAGNRRVLGEHHPTTLTVTSNLAMCFRAQGRAKEAEGLLRHALEGRRKTLGSDHPDTLATMSNLAAVCREQDRHAEAEALLEQVLGAQRRRDPAPGSLEVGATLFQLAQLRLHRGRAAEAEPLLRECLATCDEKLPDGWIRFATRSMLGAVLLAQGKHAEAEPLLLSGYEGMKRRASAMTGETRHHLADGASRLVQFYEARGQPEQLARWRKSLRAQTAASTRPSTRPSLTPRKPEPAPEPSPPPPPPPPPPQPASTAAGKPVPRAPR